MSLILVVLCILISLGLLDFHTHPWMLLIGMLLILGTAWL